MDDVISPAETDTEVSFSDVAATLAARLGGQGEAKPKEEAAPKADDSEEPESDTEEKEVEEKLDDEESPEDGETEEEEEEEESDSKAWPESASKRVGKLTAQKAKLAEEAKALSEKVAELEKSLKESYSIKPVADEKSPLASVVTRVDLEEQRKEATEALEWLIANEDGGEVSDGKGGKVTLDAKAVAAQKKVVEKILSIHMPEREQWLKAQDEANAAAQKVYPELFQPSEQSDKAFAILKKYPALNSYPDKVQLVGDMLIGEKFRSGKFVLVPKAEAKKKQDPPKAPPAGSAVIPTKKSQQSEVVNSRFLQSGSVEDAAEILKSRWA